MTAMEIVAALHAAITTAQAEHPRVPAFDFKVSFDGDHKSNEMIITDRDGQDWVISSTTLKELPPDKPAPKRKRRS